MTEAVTVPVYVTELRQNNIYIAMCSDSQAALSFVTVMSLIYPVC